MDVRHPVLECGGLTPLCTCGPSSRAATKRCPASALRRCLSLAAVMAFCSIPVFAAGLQPVLGTNAVVQLIAALDRLNMTVADAGFEKDIGKPEFALARTRALLARPLELPELGDEVLAALSPSAPEPVWTLVRGLLDLEPDAGAFSVPAGRDVVDSEAPWSALDPRLVQALNRFRLRVMQADGLHKTALEDVGDGGRRYAMAAHFAGVFNAEDYADTRAAMVGAGLAADDVARAVEEGKAVDPAPAASNFLAVVKDVDLGLLLAAARAFHGAVRDLRDDVAGVERWPSQPARFETPFGAVVVGTPESDGYACDALLVLDPGGDDRYGAGAGAANALRGVRFAAIVDLAGSDRYDTDDLLGAGAAVFGAAVVMDDAGNDTYRTAYAGQGSAFFGAAWMEDAAGDDTYRAGGSAQGAGTVGVGCLRDAAGNDVYDVGMMGQGFAGVLGVGLLVDAAGNDRYLAGGREHDYERNDDRYVSLAQGFAIGLRPFAGGGVAALVDLAGNDTYEADVFGQGVSYWYSAGLLLDAAGDDTYSVYQYGQGAGIHLSSGLLADGGGKDFYTGYILVQGAAHDYGVGMMVEQGGDDTYSADHHSQGRAINNALAVLADEGGNDAYFARQPDQCQGVGNDGDKREYGSIALLLDLAGADRYSCGAEDGARMKRPDFGIVYDVKAEE